MNQNLMVATVLTMMAFTLSIPSCTPIYIARDGAAEAAWRRCVASGYRSEAGILRCVRKVSARSAPLH